MALRYGAVLIRCSACDFTGDFSHAIAHYRETQHVLTHRGVPQNLTKFDSPEQYEREAEIRELARRGF